MLARRARAISLSLVALIASCDDEEPAVPAPAQALLDAAIAAHGGEEALARLDDLLVVARGTFRDGVEVERRIDLHAPSSFAMTISQAGRPAMTFGLAGDGCWKRHGPFPLPCRPEDLADYRRMLDVLNARLLHGIDRSAVTDAGAVTIGGVEAPALRSGALRLAFDPETHHLIRVDYEDDEHRVESFSELTAVGEAQVATRHLITIDGAPDVSETWTEIVPGGADPARLVPSAPVEPGEVFDGEDAARAVAWVDLEALDEPAPSPDERLAHARRALVAFVSERGIQPSGTDGLLVMWPASGGERVALTLEMNRRFDDVDAPPFHVETLPARRYVGVYHQGGDPRARAGALDAAIEERGLSVAADAPHELLSMPGAEELPPSERFGLLRVAVAGR